MGQFTSETAAELGRRGGQARAARRSLSLADVEREMGPLQSVDDAKRRLERLGVWCAAGLLPGSVGGAAVRSVAEWVRAHEIGVLEKQAEVLAERVEEMDRERKAAGRPRGVA